MTGLMWVAEDSDADFETLQYFLKEMEQPPRIRRFTCGDSLLEAGEAMVCGHPSEQGLEWPALLLLDLNLPGTDGREILRRIKEAEVLRQLPTLVLSTSANPKDVTLCYQLGANAYLTKPMDLDRYQRLIRTTCEFWLELAVVPSAR